MWVAKFGGSSIKDAYGICACARIVLEHDQTRLVVLSATANTTSLLEQASESPCAFEQVEHNHNTIIKELGLSSNIADDLYGEATRLRPGSKALWGALGERLSSKIFAAHLTSLANRPVSLVDAREFMITDGSTDRGTPQVEQIAKKCANKLVPLLKQGHLLVTQGFIGSNLEGQTTLLGREGSDYSATLMAEAIGASGVTIWSDVPGIFSADPNAVPDARVIPKLSYDIAKALAQSGAKILFPKTLDPARRKGIPVLVRSSREPHLKGTLISKDIRHPPGLLALVLADDKLSLIGEQIETIPIDLPEIDRSRHHRTFQIEKIHWGRRDLLEQWHGYLFKKILPKRNESPRLFVN